MHQLDWSMRRLQRSLSLRPLEGRRMDIPHIYTFVFASRIYAFHGRGYVINGRFRFGEVWLLISREKADTNLLPGLVYARLCIYILCALESMNTGILYYTISISLLFSPSPFFPYNKTRLKALTWFRGSTHQIAQQRKWLTFINHWRKTREACCMRDIKKNPHCIVNLSSSVRVHAIKQRKRMGYDKRQVIQKKKKNLSLN